MKTDANHIGLVVQLHHTDYQILEAAAAAANADIEDFAALAIYQQSKQTMAEHQVKRDVDLR